MAGNKNKALSLDSALGFGRKRKAQADAWYSNSAPECKRTKAAAPLRQAKAGTQVQTRQHQPPRTSHPSAQDLGPRFQADGAVLGSGQFGTVREGTDLATGESVACKSLCKAGAAEGGLEHEVEMMQRLQGQDSVVQLRGVWEDEHEVHMAMDLCRGGDLFDEVVRRGRFSESDAAVLMGEIVGAVGFCHSRGVMHRDLKPENILLTRTLQPGMPLAQAAREGPLTKLADFGLAAQVAPGEAISGLAGSPLYMAPEVLTGEYGLKADAWSLGVILYVLLAGRPPFWGPSDAEVFEAILTTKPDLATGPWSTVSAEAKSLVRCLLNKDPSRRPVLGKILTHPWFGRQHTRCQEPCTEVVGNTAKAIGA